MSDEPSPEFGPATDPVELERAMKLRQAIRVFCVQRQGAMAVYAYHPMDEATGAVDERDLRFVVWLRDNPGSSLRAISSTTSRSNSRARARSSTGKGRSNSSSPRRACRATTG